VTERKISKLEIAQEYLDAAIASEVTGASFKYR
jgi:hypothetical protein